MPWGKCLTDLAMLNDRLSTMYEYTFTSEYVRAADKFNFTLSIFIILTTVYLLGVSPAKYYLYWVTFMQLALYIKRGLYFKHYGYHYFMLDYCYFTYFVQSLCFVMLNPGSQFWYYVSHAFCGMVFAVFLFTNQFVFHDIDKMTGSLLHTLPIITQWNIHWNLRGTEGLQEWGFYDASNDMFTWDTVSYYYMSYWKIYFIHCLVYFGTVYLRYDVIMKNDYMCYFRNEFEGGMFAKIFRKHGYAACFSAMGATHFLFISIMYTTIIFACFFLEYLMVGYMLVVLYMLFDRAATYYIDHFPKKYEDHLRGYDELGMKYDPLKMRKKKSTHFQDK